MAYVLTPFFAVTFYFHMWWETPWIGGTRNAKGEECVCHCWGWGCKKYWKFFVCDVKRRWVGVRRTDYMWKSICVFYSFCVYLLFLFPKWNDMKNILKDSHAHIHSRGLTVSRYFLSLNTWEYQSIRLCVCFENFFFINAVCFYVHVTLCVWLGEWGRMLLFLFI